MAANSPIKKFLTEVSLYCSLFLATNFVNKYVLSVLEFKYPTIFQGWQTLVGFIVLRILVVTQHLKPMLIEENIRQDVLGWVPAMILFVISIYSGSVAMANLAIPVFFSLQNLISVIKCTGNMAISKQMTSVYSYLMVMLIICSSIAVIHTDPQFNGTGYLWICIHILSTGIGIFDIDAHDKLLCALHIYTKCTRGRLKLSSYEKLYCNYVYSVILLAPSSYLIGDALEAIRFPYLYFSEFYIGCVLSGIFGVFLNLKTIRLQEFDTDVVDFTKLYGFAKIVTSMMSLFVFNMTLTANHALCLMVNHLAGLVCEDTIPTTAVVRNADREINKYPVKHNILYNDYIRDPDDKTAINDNKNLQV